MVLHFTAGGKKRKIVTFPWQHWNLYALDYNHF